MKVALKGEFGRTQGEELFARYLHARTMLVSDVLPWIRTTEPTLTDHGPLHIRNVMENAHMLLPTGYHKRIPANSPANWDALYLSARDQYCLAMLILFHDVGNIFGRKGHEQRIGEVYDYVWGEHSRRHPEEKVIIVQGAGAHCGLAEDGSKDTLAFLKDEYYFERGKVRLREIASLLRFADELAEGPQRTSEFMRRMHQYPEPSHIYHDYASVTRVNIDPARNCIALRYDFYLDQSEALDITRNRIQTSLTYTYHRIMKLDQERKYTRFYTQKLAPFSITSAALHFWLNGNVLDLGLNPLEIDDKVVPGNEPADLTYLDEAYRPETIAGRISAILGAS